MRSGDVEVKVDGLWLRSLGFTGPPKWGSRYGDGPCGPDLASVTIELDRPNDTGFLRMGRTLEVFDRGILVWGGRISGVSQGSPREVQAKGWPRTHWDATSNPAPGARVGYDASNKSYTPVDPTTPTWLLDASDLDIGIADDRLFTQVVYTWVSSLTTGGEPVTSTSTVNDTTAQVFYGILPFELDLTALGVIAGATAVAYANQQLREFAIPEWASRVVTNSTRLLTIAGRPAHLPDVVAGQSVRMFHLPATYGGLRKAAATDVILGEVEYDTANPDEIVLAPQRVAVRSVADVVRQAAEAKRVADEAARAATTAA